MIIACANCNGQLTLPPEVLGKQVKCPLCKNVFTAPKPSLPPPLPEDEGNRQGAIPELPTSKIQIKNDPIGSMRKPLYDDADAGPPRRPSWARDDDEYDNYDDDDWYGRYDDKLDFERKHRRGLANMHAAQALVAPPAACLIVLGALFVILGLIFLMVALPEKSEHRVGLLLLSMVSLCWGSFMILGAVMMRTMKSYGLAMTASVMALVNHPIFVIHIILGIWAIVVLCKPEVQKAFRWKAEHQEYWND